VRIHGTMIGGLAALAATVLMLVAGCNDDVTRVVPGGSQDVYTLRGQVLRWPDGAPVGGAGYHFFDNGLSGTCDEGGMFSVTGLAAGGHALRLTAPGYVPILMDLFLNDGLPQKDLSAYRDFYLPAASATLRLQVMGGDTGRPLAGVPVAVTASEGIPHYGGDRVDPAMFPVTAVTDTAGVAVLTGLPPLTVTVMVGGTDADGDGVQDHGAQNVQFDLVPDDILEESVSLTPGEEPPLGILATNLLGASYLADPEAWILFTTPPDTTPELVSVHLRQNYPSQEVPFAMRWGNAGRLLTITPLIPLDDRDKSYSLTIRLADRYGNLLTHDWYLHWLANPTATGGDCDTVVPALQLATTIPALDYDTREFDIRWDVVPCGRGYRIYARDDRGHPDWELLLEDPTDFVGGEVTAHCVLPDGFDRFVGDDIQTPFAGTTVSVCVVPANAARPRPGSPHPVLTLRDQVPPRVAAVWQEGGARNTTAETQVLEIPVQFTEYMDPVAGDPALIVTEASGGSGTTLDPDAAEWLWETGALRGSFTITLPPGADVSGDSVRVDVAAVADLSGNPAVPSSSSLYLLPTGGNFDFEGSGQSWTATGQGWAWGTPGLGPYGGDWSDHCWGTTLSGLYGDGWDTSLTSPPLAVPPMGTDLRFWCWYALAPGDVVRVEVMGDAGDLLGTLDTIEYNSYGWQLVTTSLDAYAAQTIRLRFHFTTDQGNRNLGFFLDDVVIDR